MNQQWMRSNNSEFSQRCRDFTWRRLATRHSAARRPFTIQFQTRVAIITKDIVKSVRSVTSRRKYQDQM